MGIRIITDSSADFDRATAKRRQVEIVSMAVQFGNASFLDGKTITNDVFYTLLKEGRENPTTSQPTPAEFLRVFEEAKAAGDQVVAVLISSVLSGTVQSAQIAKGMCEYEDIYIVDSLSATAGIQILVNLACKLRASPRSWSGSRAASASSPCWTPWSTSAAADGSAASRRAWGP